MHERPYLLVSCAMSVDGRIDDASPDRLILSSDDDADRVDEVRASVDAILVGAGTIRRDDPRLVIRSRERRANRIGRGLPEDPVKVTVTATGDLDPAARFFTTGNAPRLVYCARPALAATRARLSGLAEVIDAGDSPSPVLILFDLAERGVASVLLEGGGQLASEFLSAGLADELHLVVAPFFVGDPDAPRFADPGGYPHGPGNRMQLAEVRQLGDVVLLRYLLGDRHPAEPPEAEAARPEAPPGSDPHPSFPLATQAFGPDDIPGPGSHPSFPLATSMFGPATPRAPGSHPSFPSAAPAPGPADAPGPGSHPSFPPATPAPGPADVAGPDSPPVAQVPRPSRSPEPASPHAADIRWLRETIELLSAEDPEPLPAPATYGDQPPGNQPPSDFPYRDRSHGGRPDSDQLHSGHPDREQPQRAEPDRQQPYGERPERDQPYSGPPDQSRGGRPEGGQSYGGPPERGQPYGGPPAPGQPYGGSPGSGQPYGGLPRPERAHGGIPGRQSYGGPPGRDQSHGGSPGREQSQGGRPDRERPYGERPYGGQPHSQQAAGPAPADLHWLRQTIELSKRCPPSQTAFSVGCVIVAADGRPLATGFSREAAPRDHAEEAALAKLARGDPRLAGATLYSSLEPCGVRASRPRPCAELIIAAGIPRVVYAWREPPLLATGGGERQLRAAGVSVTEVPGLAAEARQVNAHLTGP